MSQSQIQELALFIGPAGAAAPQSEAAIITEFTDDEGRRLVVHPGSATLSVGEAYQGIREFAQRFEAVLTALQDVVGLRRCDRLGVRYLDTVETAPDPHWTEWFRPDLLGWATGNVIQPESRVESSVSQTQLSGFVSAEVPRAHAIVRHGVAPEGSTLPGVPPYPVSRQVYFLDIDFFVAEAQRFDVESIMQQFIAIHSQIDRFFRWTLTDAGANHFGLETVHD
jgi:uncharacterized protein (TIGR04255 family)